MHKSDEVPKCVHKYTFHKPQNKFSERHRNNTTHMVFEGQLAIKNYAKDVKFGTIADRNHRLHNVTMGRVLSSGSTNDYRLSFVSIQYHYYKTLSTGPSGNKNCL